MHGKIGLEEHFATQDTIMDSSVFLPEDVWPDLKHRLLDMHETRIAQMDKYGMEMMIVSLNAPAVQAIPDKGKAIEIAKRANDALAEHVEKNQDRYRAFAALPLQDPEAAAREAERCVKELGMVGALVNGFSQEGDGQTPLYYDLPMYEGFWESYAALDVPFYLHPRNPLPQDMRIYEGHGWLMGPTWAFAHETAVHSLRLMGSGLFDKHPDLQVVLGHMGEGIPYMLWRIDHHNAWINPTNHYPARRKIKDYFLENFHITTSGNFRTQTLIDAILEVGSDRIMFSTDWPFEMVEHAATWFDDAPMSETDRTKIGRDNARKLFKLD